MTTDDPQRPDVPAAIAVVRDFVNTTDHETGTDDLTSPAALVRHLTDAGLLTGAGAATADDLDAALRLRSGLRRALELNHAGEPGHVDGLDEVLRELPVGLAWTDGRVALRPAAAGVRGALARIGLAAHDAAAEGIWWRLKVCAWDECEWAYYDHSRNRSRSYCEYGCGNKLKTRAYRARQRAAAGA